MKASKLNWILIFFMIFALNSVAQDKKSNKNNKKEVTFDVSMTCENCKKRIQKNIAFEKGVKDMNVDLPSKTVKLQFDPAKTDEAKLQKAFNNLGYEATARESEVETK